MNSHLYLIKQALGGVSPTRQAGMLADIGELLSRLPGVSEATRMAGFRHRRFGALTPAEVAEVAEKARARGFKPGEEEALASLLREGAEHGFRTPEDIAALERLGLLGAGGAGLAGATAVGVPAYYGIKGLGVGEDRG